MPIVLTANYNVELTHPGRPTHRFSLRWRAQAADLKQVKIQCARLQALLQASVNQVVSNRDRGNGQLPQGRIESSGRDPNHATCRQQTAGIGRLFANCSLDRSFIESECQARFGQPVAGLNEPQARELLHALYE